MNKNPYVLEHGKLSNEILLNVAEVLTLRLPEGIERITASKWMKKFLACHQKDYKNALSLFISSLTMQMLVEPFTQAPPEPRDQWQGFAKEYTNVDIVRAVKERLYKDAKTPPYKIEISQDLQEYVAFQEIPFFGAHFYYAFSPTEKIHQWQNFNHLKIPKKYVEVLELDYPPESPIKGRFSSLPGQRVIKKHGTHPAAPSLLIQRPRVSKKPQWEGPIDEEKEQDEPPRKALISIRNDGPIKNTPPALLQRMAEAESQKNQRAAVKSQERKESASKPRPETKLKPKSKAVVKVPKITARRSVANDSKRPQWEGLTEEEDESLAPPQRKPMIAIPTDSPAKAMPQALQRRILEAERQRKERVALRDQEHKKKDVRSRSKTPVRKRKQSASVRANKKDSSGESSSQQLSESANRTPKGARSSHSLRIRVLKRNASRSGINMRDSIDAMLRPVTPTESETEVEEQGAASKSSHESLSRQDYIKSFLAQTKLNNEIVIEREEETAEDPIKEEADNQIGQQVISIVENAGVVEEEFKDIMFQLKSLNEVAAKPMIAPDTMKRFRDIKARSQGVAVNAIAIIVEPPQEQSVENAKEIVNLLNRSLEVAQEAVENLNHVQPESNDDDQAIQNLITSNYKLINVVEAVIEPLIEAIEENNPNLNSMSAEATQYLKASVRRSNENDDKLMDNLNGTQAVLEAADIEDERNDKLESVLEDARKVTNKVIKIARQFEGGIPVIDSSVLRFMGYDDDDDDDDDYGDDDLIDVDAMDVEFEGGAINDDEFKIISQTISRQAKEKAHQDEAELIIREKAKFDSMFLTINDDDNLENVTENFNGLLDESLELMDNLEDDLSALMKTADNQQQANAIQEVIDRVAGSRNVLSKSRDEVNGQQSDSKSPFNPLLDLDDSEDEPNLIMLDTDDDQCDEC